jgi:hypothetical protein
MRLSSYLLSAVVLATGAVAGEPGIKDALQARETFEKAWAKEISPHTTADVRSAVSEILKHTDSKSIKCSLSEKDAAYKTVSEHDPRLPKIVFYYGKLEDLKDREVWHIIYSPNYLTFLHAALDPATGKVLCIWYYHDTCG